MLQLKLLVSKWTVLAQKNKDDFSAKTVKTGEILNLINGVKKLE